MSCRTTTFHHQRFDSVRRPDGRRSFNRVRRTRCSSTNIDVNQWLDEFTDLRDRHDRQPLSMPSVNSPKRVVLVRHGQSTWNAEGRIQGSSNYAELTELGKAQANTTRESLVGENFDLLLYSPLERSKKTAEIIWSERSESTLEIPQLREIDLYSLQGLLKHEGKERFGEVYRNWQRVPHELMIDGHAPVRELWYRASLAWQIILGKGHADVSSILVVAHNAVNQALICSAASLAPTYFRRFLQSNAATTVIDVQPTLNGDPRVTIDRLNQSPSPPFGSDGAGRKALSRIVLVRHGDSEKCTSDVIVGLRDEPCSLLGEVQIQKTAELLLDVDMDVVITSPLQRCRSTAERISDLQALGDSDSVPSVIEWDHLVDWDAGEWELRLIQEVRSQEIPPTAEAREVFWRRCGKAWKKMVDMAEGKNLVVVTHSSVIAALLGHCLDVGMGALSLFRHVGGGVTIIDFPEKPTTINGVVRCANYSAHLGRWSIPVTRDDLDRNIGIGAITALIFCPKSDTRISCRPSPSKS